MSKNKIRNILDLKGRGILYALLILWVAFIATGMFGNYYASILREGALVAICGVGMTFAIITGRFDLSVASMLAFQACILTELVVNRGMNTWVAILIILVLGVLCGLLNGVLIAKLKIPAFVATLGMQYCYRAFAYIVSAGIPITVSKKKFPDLFGIGNNNFLGLPILFWVMLICVIVGTFILRKTKLGRHTLALGNSEAASEISGINMDRTLILVYILVGLFTAITAIGTTSFLTSSNPGMKDGFEFNVITAVVLGGTALVGGKGSIVNTMFAALFVCTVTVGMNALGINSYVQYIVQGVLLLFAFSINTIHGMIDSMLVKRRAAKELAASMKSGGAAK